MSANSSERAIGFSWRAALLGGAASIGGSALIGTLISNISLKLSMAQGLSVEQAYARMAESSVSPSALLSFSGLLASAFCGGYASAQYAGNRPVAQSAVAGLVGAIFFVVMLLGPVSHPGPMWHLVFSLVGPVVASLLGGYVYARRV